MMKIVDPDTHFEIDLLNVQQDDSSAVADPDVYPTPGLRSSEALLVSLDAVEEISLSGTATGIRLSKMDGYDDDPVVALAEWVVEFESLISGGQGSGYNLHSDERDRTLSVFVGDLTWQRFTGETMDVSWTIDLHRGNVVDTQNAPSPLSVNLRDQMRISTGDSLYTLPTPVEYMVEKRQGNSLFPIPQYDEPDYDANEVVGMEGAIRQVNIEGRFGGSRSEINAFDEDMRSLTGGNQAVSIRLPFPGYELHGIIDFFDGVREAGRPNVATYRLSFTEGESTEDAPDFPDFQVSITGTNNPSPGSALEVGYYVENRGDLSDTQDIDLTIVIDDGDAPVVDTDENVQLGPGESAAGTLEWGDAVPGDHTALVSSLDDADSVEVEI